MDELERLIAERMRAALEADGERYETFAGRMTVLGFRWTANRVAQVVTGRGALSLLEIAGVCAALGRPLEHLVDGPGDVGLPAGTAIEIDGVRRALLEGDPNPWHSQRVNQIADALPPWGQHSEATIKAAKRLNVSPADVEAAAAELWGHTFAEERDQRATPRAGETKRQLQTRRGHAARALLAELNDYFTLPGRRTAPRGGKQ
ncbi:hypothetical protein [Trujillonella endophytica]|uniref:Uncharacterized protein n=1 Tax=Trujillonella endophytica TaxID=673521 RepID=A0A1H8UIT8_9ACTN|nr:hypothetical protein [Trujillella endophytica]SEP02784.1 hypothetical protein SAMN05660991_02930 [Trujillella endophytica]